MDCLADNKLPWTLSTTQCQVDLVNNPSNATKLYLVMEDEVADLAYFCNAANTAVCATDIDLAFDTLNEELDSTCGKLIFNKEDGGTFDFTLIEPPCIDAVTSAANATKRMVDAWREQKNVFFVIAQESGYRMAGKGKVSSRGNFTPDLASALPTGFPWTLSYVAGDSRELACNEVFPYIVVIEATALQGVGATFGPSEIKILSGPDDLMASAALAALTPEASNVGLFVNTNEGVASNLVDGDTATVWDGGLLAAEPYAGASLCYEVPLITGLEICADSAVGGADNAPTDFVLKVSGDGGITYTTLQTFTGNVWTDGECKTFIVDDPRASTGVSISGVPNVQWVYSAVETTSGTAVTETSVSTGIFTHARVTNLSPDEIKISFGDNPACTGALNYTIPTGSPETEIIVPTNSTKFNLCSDGVSSDVRVFLYRKD